MKRAVKLIDAGHSERLHAYCSRWSIRMVALYGDVALEGGGFVPWRSGSLYDHPYREILALRLIRAEWARRLEARRKK